MIGALRGTLVERSTSGMVVIDVNGVGYEVTVTAPTSASFGEIGSDVALRVHTRVREDAITLFGFAGGEEKRCFEALIGAHGVGPAMAMSLLSLHSPVALRQIVAMDDTASLSQVPGIGKKTAVRLLMELKSRFDMDLGAELIDISSTVASGGDSKRADVTAALAGLGYAGDEIRGAVSKLPSDGSAEDLVRLALKELAAS